MNPKENDLQNISEASKQKKKLKVQGGTEKWAADRRGWHHTEEAKRKIADAARGRIFSEAHRRKISIGRKGILHTEEAKRKMSLSHKGKKQSPELIEKRVAHFKGENHWTKKKPFPESAKIKISKTLTGRKLPKEVVAKMRLSANRGKDNYRWLEYPTNYGTIHHRITKDLGRPMKCEKCLSTKKKKYEWANIDGRYNLDHADWKRLCTSCHRKMDYDRLRSAGYKKNGQYGKWIKQS